MEAKGKATKAALNHPLRILIMNCQSIKNKKAELRTIIDSAKPDIILGNESWLTPDIKNSEIFQESFEYRASDGIRPQLFPLIGCIENGYNSTQDSSLFNGL